MKVHLGKEIQLHCTVCGHDRFDERKAQLNTAGMSFMNLDWLNKSALCFVCKHCGYVHWFLPTTSGLQPRSRLET